MFSIDTLGRTEFRPGEMVEVEVGWELAQVPQRVELRVVWNTSGKGTQDVGVAETVTLDDPANSERRRVTVQLPNAPYSYSGRLLSIVWAFELVVTPWTSGAMFASASDRSTRTEIVIGPEGREVLAATVGYEPST